VISVALKTPLEIKWGNCIYKISLLHRPDHYIGFTPSCPSTFYNKIAPMTTALCPIKLLSSCRMLLDTEPKYGSCNEIYLGEGEGSAGVSRCCVTPYFSFKNLCLSNYQLNHSWNPLWEPDLEN